jgi:hypothetical protein
MPLSSNSKVSKATALCRASLTIAGSAIYLYGDQVNDHGPYTVSLDSRQQVALNDRSGCGGGYAKACEKLSGLKFFAGGLGEGEHTLRFENGGPSEGDRTFFGELVASRAKLPV